MQIRRPLSKYIALLVLWLIPCVCGCASEPPAAPDPLVGTADILHQAIAPALSQDPRLTGYLNEIGNRLVVAATQKNHGKAAPVVAFHLINAGDVINTASIGAGHIYITTALFGFCDSENDLAARMAHAYAHVYLHHRHAAEGPTTSVPSTAEQIVLNLQPPRFAENLEDEADVVGIELFARGGWDPSHYNDLYQKLAQRRAASPDSQAALLRRAGIHTVLPGSSGDWRSRSVADPDTFHELQQRAAAVSSGDSHGRLLVEALPSCFFAEDQPEQIAARDAIKPKTSALNNGRTKGNNYDVAP